MRPRQRSFSFAPNLVRLAQGDEEEEEEAGEGEGAWPIVIAIAIAITITVAPQLAAMLCCCCCFEMLLVVGLEPITVWLSQIVCYVFILMSSHLDLL